MELSLLKWVMQNLYIAAMTGIPVLLLSVSVHRFCKLTCAYRHLSKIPGPNSLLVLVLLIKAAFRGTFNIEVISLTDGLSRIFNKTGMLSLWLGHMPYVLIYTPELAESVLTKGESLERPPEFGFSTSSLFGQNSILVTSPVQAWRKRRKLLNPAFHVRIIERYLNIFNKHAAIFVEKLNQRDITQPIDLLPNMKMCTMDIICETAMGIDIEAQKGKNSEYVKAFRTVMELVIQRFGQCWLHPDIVFKNLPIGRRYQKNVNILNEMSRKIITQKKSRMLSEPNIKAQIEENFVEGAKQMEVSFIDLLLYHHLYGDQRMSEEDVLGEVNVFIFVGHDTSSVTLSWALYLIGNDPRIQQAIHDELDTVLDNDRNRRISKNDILNMKYLNCVVKEVLRLHTTAGLIPRYFTKDMQINGYTVPAGTRCLILVSAIHKDPRIYPKPEAFIPERFLEGEDRHPFAYIPFAAGPRNCIGQKFANLEMMIMLASILRNFTVRSANTKDKIRISQAVVYTPLDPLMVYLKPR